jgi:hypothetical protein
LKDQKLYFGQCGFYQSGNLHTRAEMLEQLKAAVQSINQDLIVWCETFPNKRETLFTQSAAIAAYEEFAPDGQKSFLDLCDFSTLTSPILN